MPAPLHLDIELKTSEAVNVLQDSQSFKPFSKPDIWLCGNQVSSFYPYLKWFESLFQSRSLILIVVNEGLKSKIQMSENEFPYMYLLCCYMLSVRSHKK